MDLFANPSEYLFNASSCLIQTQSIILISFTSEFTSELDRPLGAREGASPFSK